MKKLLLVD